MRSQLKLCAPAALFVGLTITAATAQRPKTEPTRAFMQLKLDESQKLLAAIALEDFEEISRASQKISLLTEDENWQVIQTAEYRRHSDEFRRASNAVTEAARKKNLDGAVLAYMQMTMQCVQCHQHVRKQK
jgi:cytochrome c556